MTDKNKNLLWRVISAVVLLPAVLFLLYKGGWYTGFLLGGAAGICAHEYFTIVHKKLSAAHLVGIGLAAVMPILPALLGGQAEAGIFWLIAATFLFAWTFHLIKGPLPEAPTHAAHLLTGVIYGGLGLTALAALRLNDNGMGWVVCALVITWLNDTCAYFAGRFLGKHKLYPAVSPNKTWEGFFGGMVGSVGGLFLTKFIYFPGLRPIDCIIVGILGGILGPLGDLCESMLKRAYQVKDSGKIIPGHGGLLDRIDALIFNAPAVLLYVGLIKDRIGS